MTTAIYNAKVYVARDRFEQAVLVEDGIIAKVGSTEDVLADLPASCEKIDAGGRTVLPGINDSHMHLANLGLALSVLNVNGAKSVDEVVARGRRFIAENPGAVANGLLGFGYNQDLFEGERRLLNRHDLDRIATDIPVVVRRVCGHIIAANTRAIALCGIAAGTPQFPGGAFETEPDGTPNGVFKETAADEVMRLFPAPSFARREEMMRRAMDYAVGVGLTSVQSNDAHDESAGEQCRLMKKLCDEGNMPLRYRHQCSFTDVGRFAEFLETEYRDGWYAGKPVALGPLKLFKDGSLGRAHRAFARRIRGRAWATGAWTC